MNTICFGQQPCGFFPKRFLIAKINTARALQKKTGGRIVFFYHDSDADYRETITVMKDRMTGQEVRLNFIQENKLQKKHSPLYAKRIPLTPTLSPDPFDSTQGRLEQSRNGEGRGDDRKGWKEEILKQLPRFIDQPLIDLLASINADNVADFCLEMYRKLGLLDGIEVVRSSDSNFRNQACDINDGFADVEYKSEIVRAKVNHQRTQAHSLPSPISERVASGPGEVMNIIGALHEGGGKYTNITISDNLLKAQISPGANERFKWMQSVINCTHYIYGESEKKYLKFNDFPEVKFIPREKIDKPDLAYIPPPYPPPLGEGKGEGVRD